MPTTVTYLDYNNADSVGLPVIDTPVVERRIMANALLARWWRADAGWDNVNQRWRCRKSDAFLQRSGSAAISQATVAAFNNRHALTLPLNADLVATSVLPTGTGLSFVIVGRPGANSNVYIMSSAYSDPTAAPTRLLHQGADAASGGASWYVENAGVDLVIPGNRFAQGPFAYELSHDPVAARFSTRVWKPGALITERSVVPADLGAGNVANTRPDLWIGNLGAGEQFAEVMVFSGALHLNPDLRSMVAQYILSRYAIGPA